MIIIISLLSSFGSDKLLILPLDVILSKIAILTFAIGVMGFVGMFAISGKFGLALAVVAVVAHILGIVLLIAVRAHKYVRWVLQREVFERQSLQTWDDTVVRVELLLAQITLLESSDSTTIELFIK